MNLEVWTGFNKWRYGKPWMTNVVLSLLGYGLLMLARQYVSETDHFTIGFSGVSGWSVWLYVAAIIVVLTQPMNRATLWIVLGWALAMRAMVLFEPPFLSSDIYRYVWDGIVQHAGINPYHYIPGDRALTFLQARNQQIFDNINRRNFAPTIYPPVAQMVFWVSTFFEPSVQAMKACMFFFECVTVAALIPALRRLGKPAEQVLLYAWCPMLVWEIGASGHVDAIVYAFIALALLFRSREDHGWVGVFLGCAVMSKFYPLVLVPALWKRRDWKMPAALVSVCVVGYAIYSSVGWHVFGYLGGYSKEEGIDSGSRFFLLDLVHSWAHLWWIPMWLYMLFCAGVLGAISWWCWRYATVSTVEPDGSVPAFVRGAAMSAFAMMLLFSPHYAWYIAWLVPLFAVDPTIPLLAYIGAFFYGFTTQWALPGPKMFFLNKCIYGFVLLAFVVAWAWKRWQVGRHFDCHEVSV